MTKIGIELLIVVLGVFIGLQANNWNDERREAAREQAYLNFTLGRSPNP